MFIPLSTEETKKQDHSAPSAGMTCSTNELMNHTSEFGLASFPQCLCIYIQVCVSKQYIPCMQNALFMDAVLTYNFFLKFFNIPNLALTENHKGK